MDLDQLEQLKQTLRQLPPATQDSLAGLLLVERLKRNRLIMPDLHQRMDDADPKKWQSWEQTQNSLSDEPS